MIVEACRYNRWANLLLLDVCEGLSARQLMLSSRGTYGSIASTLMHLVGAERRYLWRLGGQVGRFSQHRTFPGVRILKEQAVNSGDALVEIAARIKASEVLELSDRHGRFRAYKSVILVQAIHHGNDHRTHACTILGAHHLPYPEMDVWSFGEATGKLVELGKA
ncbi:MAG: DinB family protein [Candidatus Dormibacterales bacterium]